MQEEDFQSLREGLEAEKKQAEDLRQALDAEKTFARSLQSALNAERVHANDLKRALQVEQSERNSLSERLGVLERESAALRQRLVSALVRALGDRLTGGGVRSLSRRIANRSQEVGNRLTGGGVRALAKRLGKKLLGGTTSSSAVATRRSAVADSNVDPVEGNTLSDSALSIYRRLDAAIQTRRDLEQKRTD